MTRQLTSTIGVRFVRFFDLQASVLSLAALAAILLASYITTAVAIEILGLAVPALNPTALAEDELSEQQKKALERAREQAKQAAERQREQAKKAAERQREQAKKAAERQREQAKKQSENSRELEKDSAERSQEKAKNKGEHAEKGYAHEKEEFDDDYPPSTVVDLIKRLVQPKTKSKPKRAKPKRADVSIKLPPSARATFKRNEILAPNLTKRSRDLARRLGFKVENAGRFSTLGATISKLITPPGLDARSARRLLRRNLPDKNLSLNKYYRIYRAARGDNQKRRGRPLRTQLPGRSRCIDDQCYGLSLIKWRPALRDCTRAVKVGVIDTPIDHRHPAFSGKDVHVGTFVTGSRKKSADWHGTGVLSLLTGDSNTTTPGLIPRASFYVADVFSQDASGSPVAESLSLLKAFDWMDAFGVKIINLSLAGPKDPLIEKAIARLSNKGIIFVAAAGNNGPTAPPNYPAAYPPVIAVTAVNKKMRNYRYANRGTYIDVAAPGVGIWTAAPGRKEGYRSGTSFAVPFMTAVAATHYRQLEKPSKGSLLGVIATRDLGPPGRDQIYGHGLILAPPTCSDRRPGQTVPAVVAKKVR
ncbi:MAG: S8 family serine peptidase [Hyphomicrobiaceae bacterium]